MPTNSTRTWVDDQRKDHIDTKGPKQRNHPKQLQTHNLPTKMWKILTAQRTEEIYYSLTKISHEVINFIDKTMKTWRVKLTAGGRRLAEAKIQRGLFQGDDLSPLLFIIGMIPLNHILRKCTAGYILCRLQEKVNHLMYMDDIKLFAKNEKELETLIHTVRIYSRDIGMEFGIEKCAMLVMKSGKRHLTDGMELPKIRLKRSQKTKPTNTWASRRLTPSNKCKWKIKFKKNISGELENYSR